jgi:hypothetical protein
MDVSLTGFEPAEIDLLFADRSPGPDPEDTVPPLPQKAATQPGDLWSLGKHWLLCGDARKADNFDRLMRGVSAAAVFCDPPYNVSVRAIGGRGRIRHSEFAFASGEMRPAQYRQFLCEALGNGVEVSAQGAIHYVGGARHPSHHKARRAGC